MSGFLSLPIGFYNKDKFKGLQIGIENLPNEREEEYHKNPFGNKIIATELEGLQIGLINNAKSGKYLQIGGINASEGGKGVQVGAINCNNRTSGLAIGLINYGKIHPETDKNGYVQLGLLNIRRKEIKGEKCWEVTPLVGWYNLK